MKTPDITPMQILVGTITGVLTAGISLVNIFGWYDISGEQAAAVLAFWTALGAVAVIADAVIRNGRSRAFQNPPKPPVATTSEDETAST